jgi:hypothetical protein
MPDGTPPENRTGAEDAALANAGEAQRGQAGAQADVSPPTAEELDERDENFTKPRKAMGPDQGGVSETIPDEP